MNDETLDLYPGETRSSVSSLIDQQNMWDRLIAVVEEQAQALQRTAFSTIVRESGDLAAGLFDAKGRMLAQAITGTPGHINSMALSVGHVMARYPVETMREGDVFIHNDPWQGTGHTNDVCLTTPCYFRGKLVGFLACNSHLADIGGLRDLSASTDVFMEGLYLPILKVVQAGEVDTAIIQIIEANTRQPAESVGDVYSMINCNDVGCSRLIEMMTEFAIDDLEVLGEHIIATSKAAVEAEIRKLPQGTWKGALTLDGQGSPVELRAALTISGSQIHVDYTGTDGMTERNFNVPLCYTLAYTSFALGCIVARNIPNNAGSLAPRSVSAPVGCILNAVKPAAVLARHLVGLMLPDLVFNCLRQAIPERVPAEGSGVHWGINIMGARTSPPRIDDRYFTNVVTAGGMGALPFRDGLSATGFPSGIRGGSIEIFEAMSSVIVWRKEYRQDSGGAGQFRGGLGQVIELENGIAEPFLYSTIYERVKHPASGANGGHSGARGIVSVDGSLELPGKGQHAIAPGQRVTILSSGGGGLGDPKLRDQEAVRSDLMNGFISEEAAADIYGYRPN
jgi:N-methylhydantoinase B